jgi:hypothetical protein
MPEYCENCSPCLIDNQLARKPYAVKDLTGTMKMTSAHLDRLSGSFDKRPVVAWIAVRGVLTTAKRIF